MRWRVGGAAAAWLLLPRTPVRLTAFAHAATQEVLFTQCQGTRRESLLVTQILEFADHCQRVAEKLVLHNHSLTHAGLLRKKSRGQNRTVVLDDYDAVVQRQCSQHAGSQS